MGKMKRSVYISEGPALRVNGKLTMALTAAPGSRGRGKKEE